MDEYQAHWNRVYGPASERATEVSAFAREVAAVLPAGRELLELGCGPGVDSAFFAGEGHRVTATDISSVAIERDCVRFQDQPNLIFAVVDMREPLPFDDGRFDAVYARLSLHYFPDAGTRAVFREIRRVLKAGGLLAFMCKSTEDPLYGRGEQLEPDMFRLNDRARHFFSEPYARDLLSEGWRIDRLSSGPQLLYGEPSAAVTVIARVLSAES
jgi:SAM-dependent methyltransferase